MKNKKLILTMTTLVLATTLAGCSTSVSVDTPQTANVSTAATETATLTADTQETYITVDEEASSAASDNTVSYAEGIPNDNNTNTDYVIPEEEELAVSYEYKIDEATNREYAVICCEGTKGTYWEYETAKLEIGQASGIEQLSSPSGAVYINEGGTIKAINAIDGHILWENSDYQGSGSVSTVDENGILYIAGYESPALLVINKEGKTLHKTEAFGDYFWPYEMTITDNILTIKFDSETDASVNVDIRDYSYSIQ